MPELKRNFINGRINKDFDERLVQKGEYRDALNIEISTSEGSNVGAVQTLRGNVDGMADFSNDASAVNAITVGQYVDEENNSVYSFVHKVRDTFEDTNYSGYDPGDKPRIIGFKTDVILQHLKDPNSSSTITSVVFSDVYEARVANGIVYPNNLITGLSNFSFDDNGVTRYSAASIKPGMRVQAIDVNGVDLWGNNDVRVVNVSSNSNNGAVEITPVVGYALGYNEHYGNSMINDGVVLRFTSDRILNFDKGTEELENNNKLADGNNVNSTAQYTPNKNIITGINIIKDLLYWTDGKNEPKKINISNSIKGTSWCSQNLSQQVLNSTKLYIPQASSYKSFIKESNVTVIKPAPTKELNVETSNKSRKGAIVSTIKRYSSSNGGTLSHFAFRGEDGVFPIGYTGHYLAPVNQDVNWKVGDTLDLIESTDSNGDSTVNPKTAVIRLISEFNENGITYFRVELVGLNSQYAADEGAMFWKASLAETDVLYKTNFSTFAYRYKYTDNEVSVISPYTQPVFMPGRYNYDPKEGFNLGMENQMKFVELRDFIPNDMPDDVVEVEILYRDTNKANQVNSIAKININDAAWNIPGSGSNKGYLRVDAEVFGATIPSDQVDRNEDSVPTSALAQEITESRLMYGNYTEGYDLIDNSNNKINLNIDAWLSSKPNQTVTSTEYSSNIFSAVQDTPSDITSGIIPCNFEEEDPGDNYNKNIYQFEAPIDGVYSFSAAGKWYGKQRVQATNYLGGTSHFWHQPSAKLVLKDNISNVIPSTTSHFSQGGTVTNEYSPALNAPNTFYNWNNGDNQPSWGTTDLSLEASNIYLTAGAIVRLHIEANTDVPSNFTYNFNSDTSIPQVSNANAIQFAPTSTSDFEGEISSTTFSCTAAPAEENTIVVSKGVKSIKSMRTLNVGVVYRDEFNRQSTVMLDESLKLDIDKSQANVANSLSVSIKNRAPHWAKYYKFFVKENTSQFHNLVMTAAYENNDIDDDQQHAWLLFNSVDINKIKEEEYLILKKQHGTADAVLNTNAKWKVLEITETTPESILGDEPVTTGKFFIKISRDAAFNTYFGGSFDLLGPNSSGAVFETEPKQTQQSDETSLYWEASQAFPIRLDSKNAESYINVGTRVEYYDSSYADSSNTVDAIKSQFNNVNVKVTSVFGASTFSKHQIDNTQEYQFQGNSYEPKQCYCVVHIDGNPINISVSNGNYVDLKFTKDDGSFVVGRVVANSVNDNRIYLLPYTCPVSDYTNNDLPKNLSWYNCFMFGNGVESDTIRDDFNADTVHEYIASGKTSGFKASVFYEDYKKESKVNDVIFSQIFNEKTNVNRFNEFLLAQPIVKQLSPEYGSIQKMFTRDTDLIVFCENKVLKVLANKDELFNADGNSQLLSSTNVLGRAIPFSGDYGISKNPESFAKDEFRVYFTDKARGAVLRLSRDGITNISNYGMKDWFYDNMANAQALIGSFDGKKDEYNLTIHSVTNPESKKDVYTLSFSEGAKGWSSFKSFIKEVGSTLNNVYYTFKNGRIWSHHSEDVSRNNFYGNQYDSSITPIVNDESSSVKDFTTISYEGTRSKVSENLNKLDNNFYNIQDASGWYVNSVKTDLQEGKVNEFISREGKWFNSISGEATTFENDSNGNVSGNLDTREFNVQGIGVLNANPTLISGTIDGFGYKLTLNISTGENFSSESVILNNITNIDGTTDFVITPDAGIAISADQFETVSSTSYYSSITFSDSGEANTASNTVIGTVNWISQPINSLLVLPAIDLSYVEGVYLPKLYESVVDVFHDKTNNNVDITNYLPTFDFTDEDGNGEWFEVSGTIVLNGASEVSAVGLTHMWPAGIENGEVFELSYNVVSSNIPNNELKLAVWGNSILSEELILDSTTSTHTVDLTVKESGNANGFYMYIQDVQGRVIINNISLLRKVDQGEVVSFSNVNEALTISDDLLSSSSTQSRFTVSGYLPGGVVNSMYDVKLQSHGGSYYSSLPELLMTSQASENHSIINQTAISNDINQTVGKIYSVTWSSDNNVSFEDNNNFTFGQDSIVVAPQANFTQESSVDLAISSLAQTINIPINSNSDVNNINITSGSSFITSPSVVSVIFNSTLGINSFGEGVLQVTLTENTSGAERSGSITITNSNNTSGTPNDTVNINQLDSGQNYVDITEVINSVETSSFIGGDNNFYILENSTGDNYIPLTIIATSTSPTALSVSDFNVTVNSGDSGWLSIESVEPLGGNNYEVNLQATAQDTNLDVRDCTLKLTYPGDATTFDEFDITQNFFNPAVDTISLEHIGGDYSNNVPWYGSSNASGVVRITSSVSGSSLPTVRLGQAKEVLDPIVNTYPGWEYVQSQGQGFFDIEDFVTLGDVVEVTGQAWTHEVSFTISNYNFTESEDVRLQNIEVYHQDDVAESVNYNQDAGLLQTVSITQSDQFNPVNPS